LLPLLYLRPVTGSLLEPRLLEQQLKQQLKQHWL
jgi:hypothetical protein